MSCLCRVRVDPQEGVRWPPRVSPNRGRSQSSYDPSPTKMAQRLILAGGRGRMQHLTLSGLHIRSGGSFGMMLERSREARCPCGISGPQHRPTSSPRRILRRKVGIWRPCSPLSLNWRMHPLVPSIEAANYSAFGAPLPPPPRNTVVRTTPPCESVSICIVGRRSTKPYRLGVWAIACSSPLQSS